VPSSCNAAAVLAPTGTTSRDWLGARPERGRPPAPYRQRHAPSDTSQLAPDALDAAA
jgi:hypothetical protein